MSLVFVTCLGVGVSDAVAQTDDRGGTGRSRSVRSMYALMRSTSAGIAPPDVAHAELQVGGQVLVIGVAASGRRVEETATPRPVSGFVR